VNIVSLINAGGNVPVAPLMGFPGIQLTGTKIKENLEDAEIQFKTLNELYKRFQPDAMFYMMDLSVEAEALGLRVLKPETSSFTVIEHPVIDRSDLNNLVIPDPEKDGRMPLFLKLVKMMSSSFTCSTVAYVSGPYTLAGLMSGASRVIKSVLKDPEYLKELLDFSTRVIAAYGQKLIEAGADMICILEPTATGLSPDQFKRFSGNYIKSLKKEWNHPVILHICGDTDHLITEMVKTDCEGISLDSMVNILAVINRIPEDVMVLGNVDPVNIMAYGEKKEVEEKVRSLLMEMKGRNNFVLSTGCDLPPDTNLHNIEYLINLARKRV
jgi:uroporphyrinogen decarboxylase